MKLITVGRSSSNDVIINDSLVSRTHCQIIQDDNGNYRLIDTNSKNGTFVNGRQIGRNAETRLNKNDIIRIGKTTLPWQTYFNDIKETKSVGTLWSDQNNIVNIGRGAGNDIIVNDNFVSSSHCQIIQDDHGGFIIIDNSRNGTFVNGVRIGKGFGTRLNWNDIIRIGNTTLPWQQYFPHPVIPPSPKYGTDQYSPHPVVPSPPPPPPPPEPEPYSNEDYGPISYDSEQKTGVGTIALILSIVGAGFLIYSAIRLIKWGIIAWIGNASTFALVSFGINIIACILAGIADYNEYKDADAAEIAGGLSGCCIFLEIGCYLYLRFGDPNLMNPFKDML